MSSNALNTNLVCFDRFSAKDNIVQLSVAVRQAFLCALFRSTGSEKVHVRPARE